jgi:hypothetical protein
VNDKSKSGEVRPEEESDVQDFRMRYQVLIDDLKSSKTQQWRVVYYVIALFFGIAGFRGQFPVEHPLCDWQKKFLMIIPWLLSVGGTYMLLRFQRTMQGYREELKYDILPHLSKCFKTVHGKRFDSSYLSFCKDIELVIGLVIAMFLGAFLLTWLP